jgi:hypothetical protein
MRSIASDSPLFYFYCKSIRSGAIIGLVAIEPSTSFHLPKRESRIEWTEPDEFGDRAMRDESFPTSAGHGSSSDWRDCATTAARPSGTSERGCRRVWMWMPRTR